MCCGGDEGFGIEGRFGLLLDWGNGAGGGGAIARGLELLVTGIARLGSGVGRGCGRVLFRLGGRGCRLGADGVPRWDGF